MWSVRTWREALERARAEDPAGWMRWGREEAEEAGAEMPDVCELWLLRLEWAMEEAEEEEEAEDGQGDGAKDAARLALAREATQRCGRDILYGAELWRQRTALEAARCAAVLRTDDSDDADEAAAAEQEQEQEQEHEHGLAARRKEAKKEFADLVHTQLAVPLRGAEELFADCSAWLEEIFDEEDMDLVRPEALTQRCSEAIKQRDARLPFELKILAKQNEAEEVEEQQEEVQGPTGGAEKRTPARRDTGATAGRLPLWREYIAFERQEGQLQRAQRLYERACFDCISEPSVWIAYTDYCMLELRDPSLARGVARRAVAAVPTCADLWHKHLLLLQLPEDVDRLRTDLSVATQQPFSSAEGFVVLYETAVTVCRRAAVAQTAEPQCESNSSSNSSPSADAIDSTIVNATEQQIMTDWLGFLQLYYPDWDYGWLRLVESIAAGEMRRNRRPTKEPATSGETAVEERKNESDAQLRKILKPLTETAPKTLSVWTALANLPWKATGNMALSRSIWKQGVNATPQSQLHGLMQAYLEFECLCGTTDQYLDACVFCTKRLAAVHWSRPTLGETAIISGSIVTLPAFVYEEQQRQEELRQERAQERSRKRKQNQKQTQQQKLNEKQKQKQKQKQDENHADEQQTAPNDASPEEEGEEEEAAEEGSKGAADDGDDAGPAPRKRLRVAPQSDRDGGTASATVDSSAARDNDDDGTINDVDTGAKQGQAPGGRGDEGTRMQPRTVLIINLAYTTTEEHLREFCTTVGEVENVRLLRRPDGRARGIAYVDYKTAEAATTARETLHGTELDGRTLSVQAAVHHNDMSRNGRERDGALHPTTVFISNLPAATTPATLDELEGFFEQRCGADSVVAVRMLGRRNADDTAPSSAVVQLVSPEAMRSALAASGVEFNGTPLKVVQSRFAAERARRGSESDGGSYVQGASEGGTEGASRGRGRGRGRGRRRGRGRGQEYGRGGRGRARGRGRERRGLGWGDAIPEEQEGVAMSKDEFRALFS